MEQGFPITSALFSCMPLMKPCLKLAMLTYCLRLVENGAPDRIRYPKKSQYIQCFSDDGTKRNVAKLLE